MLTKSPPKFRSHVPLRRRLKIVVLAAAMGFVGGFTLWNCIDNLQHGYISLPTGRHSSIALHLAEKSPALILAFLFHAAIILLFGGGGLLFLRDAMRTEPRSGNGRRRSE